MEAGIYKAILNFPHQDVYLLICEDSENPNYTRIFVERGNKRNVKPNGQWNFSGKIEDSFLFGIGELRESDLRYTNLERIAELSELEHRFVDEYRIKLQ